MKCCLINVCWISRNLLAFSYVLSPKFPCEAFFMPFHWWGDWGLDPGQVSKQWVIEQCSPCLCWAHSFSWLSRMPSCGLGAEWEKSWHSRRTYQSTTREICEKGSTPRVVSRAEWRQELWQPGTGDSTWGRGGGKRGAHWGQMGSWRVGFTIRNMYVACSLGISCGKRDKGAFIFQKRKVGKG